MDKILVFGHKSPDTDTITSSLVMEKYLKNKNIDAKAVRLGNVNKETKYVLNYLKIEEPELIDTLEDGQKVDERIADELNQMLNDCYQYLHEDKEGQSILNPIIKEAQDIYFKEGKYAKKDNIESEN